MGTDDFYSPLLNDSISFIFLFKLFYGLYI